MFPQLPALAVPLHLQTSELFLQTLLTNEEHGKESSHLLVSLFHEQPVESVQPVSDRVEHPVPNPSFILKTLQKNKTTRIIPAHNRSSCI
jgi:hypothetical protein